MFGLGKRLDNSKELAMRTSEKFSIQPLSSDDMGEIRKIQDVLNPDENVIIVARQSRILPGGSYVTPNTIYATEKRLIIRDPYMLGVVLTHIGYISDYLHGLHFAAYLWYV